MTHSYVNDAMVHRSLGDLLAAGTVLLVMLACSGATLAVQRGVLLPPALSIQLSRRPFIGLVAFTTRCRAAGSGTVHRQQRYQVLLYAPDGSTSWETSGHFLVDMPIPC
jgi:hypothetical protein